MKNFLGNIVCRRKPIFWILCLAVFVCLLAGVWMLKGMGKNRFENWYVYMNYVDSPLESELVLDKHEGILLKYRYPKKGTYYMQSTDSCVQALVSGYDGIISDAYLILSVYGQYKGTAKIQILDEEWKVISEIPVTVTNEMVKTEEKKETPIVIAEKTEEPEAKAETKQAGDEAPTLGDTELQGVYAGYAFLPIQGEIRRYSMESVGLNGLTKGQLLYECTEEAMFDEKHDWQFYALEEYEDFEKIYAVSLPSGAFVYVYSPGIGVEESEIEQCIQDGMVVYENGNIASGKDIWEAFYEKVEKQEHSFVDLAYVYRNDENAEEEWKLATMADYPSLFMNRLSYDGREFLLEPLHRIDGEYVVMEEEGYDSPARTYAYLMHYEGEPAYEGSGIKHYDRFVLTNSDTVTWEELEWGSMSSQLGDYIPYNEVFCEYEFNE